jgi:diaminohydroxyphosphoribosylaminopyrimidine deaminase/5-amino-6-(5-phosphoribosylamino)uracil reductase
VLADEAKQLLAPFIARVAYDRPYVTLKWAQTADDKVAGPEGRRLQISNARSSHEVHALRGRSDAIVVASNTVQADDPLLTPRDVEFSRRPMRVILDTSLRISMGSKLVRTARDAQTLVCFASDLHEAERDKIRALHEAGVEPCVIERSANGLKLDAVLAALAALRVTHVLIEAGPTLASGFFALETLVDRVWLIRSRQRVNDPTAPAAPGVPASFKKTGEVDLDGDDLCEFLNPASPVFFAAEPSADFMLVQAAAPPLSAQEDAR